MADLVAVEIGAVEERGGGGISHENSNSTQIGQFGLKIGTVAGKRECPFQSFIQRWSAPANVFASHRVGAKRPPMINSAKQSMTGQGECTASPPHLLAPTRRLTAA